MAIKAIVELQAKPGRRDELKRVLESLIATSGPDQDGFLGSTR
jgi:quinol monooxygenase YgiN